MLGKLIKHEFGATARIMLPASAAMLLVSALGRFSIRVLDHSDSTILNIIGGLIIIGFSLGLMATCIASTVLMITRFYRNLFSDEGYLMFTLPTSIHSIVWSKIIVSVVWFIVTFLIVALSAVIVSFEQRGFMEFIHNLGPAFSRFFEEMRALDINWVLIAFEWLILILFGLVDACLIFYAAFSTGCSFSKHKTLLSVLFFLGYSFVMNIILSTSIFGIFDNFSFHAETYNGAFNVVFLIAFAFELAYFAVFYFITTCFLRKRLNLQ